MARNALPSGPPAIPLANASAAPFASPALEARGLAFSYGSKAVLRDISFSVPQGSVTGLFGPNGSGKTTLFRCCLGLLHPQAGSVSIAGQNVRGLGIAELARRVAYVPQEHRPGFPFLVREVVAMGRTPRMRRFFSLTRADLAIVEEAMEKTGIRELADEPCTKLSGGQRQLAYLARALAQEAPLMLLDEPTSALDFNNQMLVWKTLRRIAQEGVTALVCCHDPNHILWFCDSVAVLRQGRMPAFGPSGEVLTGELLRDLYGPGLEIREVDGKPLVRPV